MRQSNFNELNARLTRGTLFLTAVSVLSLHAMAQTSDSQKPLPSPILPATVETPVSAKADVAAVKPAARAAVTPAPAADVKLTEDSLRPSSAKPAAAATPVGNRMTGFAAPAETANALSKPDLPLLPAATPQVTAQAAPIPGAASRAGIRRLNKVKPSTANVQHPLAAAYPGFDVIVCIAGCGPEPKAVSVYRPKPRLQQLASMESGFIQATMVTTSYNDDTAQNPLLLKIATECLAGCYDNAPRARAVAPASVAAAVPPASAPVGATDRAVMLPTSTGFKAVTQHPKPKVRNRSGSDWFTRRFSTQSYTHTHTQSQ